MQHPFEKKVIVRNEKIPTEIKALEEEQQIPIAARRLTNFKTERLRGYQE